MKFWNNIPLWGKYPVKFWNNIPLGGKYTVKFWNNIPLRGINSGILFHWGEIHGEILE